LWEEKTQARSARWSTTRGQINSCAKPQAERTAGRAVRAELLLHNGEAWEAFARRSRRITLTPREGTLLSCRHTCIAGTSLILSVRKWYFRLVSPLVCSRKGAWQIAGS